MLRAVPNVLREGALALGATRWDAVRVAVLPPARSGIVGAIVLGLGRALGETMAVTMVIGNRAEISASLFAPSATRWRASSPTSSPKRRATCYLSALSELGLLLFAVTLLLNIIARVLVWRVSRMPGGAGEDLTWARTAGASRSTCSRAGRCVAGGADRARAARQRDLVRAGQGHRRPALDVLHRAAEAGRRDAAAASATRWSAR